MQPNCNRVARIFRCGRTGPGGSLAQSRVSCLTMPSNKQTAVPGTVLQKLLLLVILTSLIFANQEIANAQIPHPHPADVALFFNKPWEGEGSNYVTVFQDGPLYRMYYRGSDDTHSVVCYAVSADGIHWTRPDLGLFAFNGSKHNNIVWETIAPYSPPLRFPGKHGFYATIKDATTSVIPAINFAPFIDTNPKAKQKYKALLGSPPTALSSPDGIHWHLLSSGPVMTGESYDSLNTALWNPGLRKYVAYVRGENSRGRQIVIRTSSDFLHWGSGTLLTPEGTPTAQLYTNGVIAFDGLYLGFPAIFHPLGGKPPLDGYMETGFMVSKDGLHWTRFHAPFIPLGSDPENMNHGSLIMARGILKTGPGELSVYYIEHSNFQGVRLRRAILGTADLNSFGFGL